MKVVSGYNRLVLPPKTAILGGEKVFNNHPPKWLAVSGYKRLAVCGAVITIPFEQP
jgi:hypothetical protein